MCSWSGNGNGDKIGNGNSIGIVNCGYDEYNDYDRDHNDIHNNINQYHYYMTIINHSTTKILILNTNISNININMNATTNTINNTNGWRWIRFK